MTGSESKQVLGEVKYATVFRKTILEIDCDVDVVVDLVTLESLATVSMRRIFGSQPAFLITLDNLKFFESGLKEIKKSVKLLNSLVPNAVDHQLNVNIGGSTATVVQPSGKPARYTLSIGLFHREGKLSELNLEEIGESIKVIETLVAATVSKVRSSRP